MHRHLGTVYAAHPNPKTYKIDEHHTAIALVYEKEKKEKDDLICWSFHINTARKRRFFKRPSPILLKLTNKQI